MQTSITGQLPKEPDTPVQLREAEIIEVTDGDVLKVKLSHLTATGAPEFFIMRPYLLRKIDAWNDISYTYTGAQERTASKSGETDENQEITPQYVIGDKLHIIGPVLNGGVVHEDGDTTYRCAYTDLNTDGRQWAVVT